MVSAIFGVIFGVTLVVFGGVLLANFGLIVVIYLVTCLIAGLLDYLESDNIAIIQINEPYQRFKASKKMGHFSILQHYHLLYLLRKKGLLPYKLVDFLNTITERYILESGRATWRFRHRILQEYFAERWVE